MNQNWHYTFPKKLLLKVYSSLKHSLSTTVLVAFHPGFQIKVPQMTIHSDLLQLKQRNSMEILIAAVGSFIVGNDREILVPWTHRSHQETANEKSCYMMHSSQSATVL